MNNEGNPVKKSSGVVCGINPYNNHLILHNSFENILLVGPESSGKSVGVVIPTGLMWENSVFFLDINGEKWIKTSKYRKDKLGQRVLKFEPLCSDGSSVRWNPLAEVGIKTLDEYQDVSAISENIIADNYEFKIESFEYVNILILNCVMLHLLYKHHKERKHVPSLYDIGNFLAIYENNIDVVFEDMYTYHHISINDFFKGNIFEKIYGEYIQDFTSFNKVLVDFLDDENPKITNLASLKNVLKNKMKSAKDTVKKSDEIDWNIYPYNLCLTHPIIVKYVGLVLKQKYSVRTSIFKNIQSKMALYQDSIIKNNISFSDFSIKDFMKHDQAVSLYFVIRSLEVYRLSPLVKLLLNLIFYKFRHFDNCNKQRLLLMLDDFPQLGYLHKIEYHLLMCTHFGIKVCVVIKDIHQLNKIYTENNSILNNCRIHIYYTPCIEPSMETAMIISKSVKTMTFDEIMRMESNKGLIIIAGESPLKVFNLKYYDTKSVWGLFFMDRINF